MACHGLALVGSGSGPFARFPALIAWNGVPSVVGHFPTNASTMLDVGWIVGSATKTGRGRILVVGTL
eukprot:3877987-Lingulodinium_polyedra.AAC.1